MTFQDIFKSSFLENISAVSVLDMTLALILAFALGLFIFLIYKKSYCGLMYSAAFGVTLITLTLITALLMLAVTSNIVLSLGMVGALSIVRFRTAIKEPMDIAFLFWSIAAGIVLAALLYAKRVADKAKLIEKPVYDADIMNLERVVERDYKHKIRVVHISGAFFFGSATQLISHFDELLGTRYLILVYDSDDMLDISAVFALEDIILRLKSQHIKILLVINSEDVRKQLQNYDVISQIGEKHVFFSEVSAIDYAKTSFKKRVKKKYSGK